MNTLVRYRRPFHEPLACPPAPTNGTGAQDPARPRQKARPRPAVRPVAALPVFPPAAEPAHAEPARLTLRPATLARPEQRAGARSWARQGKEGGAEGPNPRGEGRRRSHDAVSLFTRGAAGSFGLSQALGSVSVSLPVRGRFGAGGEPTASAGGSGDCGATAGGRAVARRRRQRLGLERPQPTSRAGFRSEQGGREDGGAGGGSAGLQWRFLQGT